MGKKLLVILGIAAIAGFVFRDQIAAGALALVEKFNSLADDPTEDTWGMKPSDEDDVEEVR